MLYTLISSQERMKFSNLARSNLKTPRFQYESSHYILNVFGRIFLWKPHISSNSAINIFVSYRGAYLVNSTRTQLYSSRFFKFLSRAVQNFHKKRLQNKCFINSVIEISDKIRHAKSPEEIVADIDETNVQWLKFEIITRHELRKLVKELPNKER